MVDCGMIQYNGCCPSYDARSQVVRHTAHGHMILFHNTHILYQVPGTSYRCCWALTLLSVLVHTWYDVSIRIRIGISILVY